MNTQYLDYTDGEFICEAYVAYDESQTSKRPCVLVSHQWSGQSDVEREKVEQLAQLGYVGFAIDIYGKGVRGGLLDDNSKLMQPFLDDRAMLRRRIIAAAAAGALNVTRHGLGSGRRHSIELIAERIEVRPL
jgi:dienelactone hydrolase